MRKQCQTNKQIVWDIQTESILETALSTGSHPELMIGGAGHGQSQLVSCLRAPAFCVLRSRRPTGRPTARPRETTASPGGPDTDRQSMHMHILCSWPVMMTRRNFFEISTIIPSSWPLWPRVYLQSTTTGIQSNVAASVVWFGVAIKRFSNGNETCINKAHRLTYILL